MSAADREQLRELASLHALGVLSPDERAELAAAVAADPELAAEVRELEDTAGALGGVVPQVDPPARLRARVLAAAGIDTEPAIAAGAAPVPRGTAAGAAPSATTSTAAPRGILALPGWLAAAAALILASGLGLWGLELRSTLQAMNARVERAEAEVVRIQRTLDESQAQTRILQAHNSVLFAPDMQRVDLAGEGPAPASKARAFMSRQSGVAFAADQLPALPADRVYQLWVVPQNAAPVSAGLLAPDPSGHASLFFPMPRGVTAPQALAVTVEPAGGLPAPSGARVLLGTVAASTAS